MDTAKALQNRHIIQIAKLNGKIHFDDASEVKKVRDMVLQREMNQSAIGQKFIVRLENILGGQMDGKCLFCGSDVHGKVICSACEEKVNRMTQTASAPPSVQKNESLSYEEKVENKDEAVPVSASVMKDISAVKESLEPAVTTVKRHVTKTVDTITEKVNVMAGGSGKVDLRLKDLFSAVFKKHESHEAEEIFICGTKYTTPEAERISAEWPKPWLFSRIFLLLFAAFYILLVCYSAFENTNVIPGIIFIGSCMVPFAVLIFFFEVNAPRNISIFDVVKIFFLGGCASLLVTLFIFSVYSVDTIDYAGAIMIGVIEEVGKLIIVAWFIRRMKEKKYILNGMLIGAAVGAGFAVFESAGYAMRYYIMGLLVGGSSMGYDTMLDVIYGRAILSPGGHIAWAAFSGATLLIVMGKEPFRWSHLWSGRFLKFLAIPIAMHAVWDMPFGILQIGSFQLKHIILVALVWIIILVLLHRGLEEINQIEKEE